MRILSAVLIAAAVFVDSGLAQDAPAEAGSAPADVLITNVLPPDMLAVIEQFGTAVMTERAGEDPLIVVALPKYRYGVFLSNCQARFGPCASIDYRAQFRIANFGLEQCNAWNFSKRFVSCSIGENGDVLLQLNVDLSKGSTSRGLIEYTTLWHVALSQFDPYFQ